MASSPTDEFNNSIGGTVILMNSTFENCFTREAGGGVLLNRDASLYVMGNLNRCRDAERVHGGKQRT